MRSFFFSIFYFLKHCSWIIFHIFYFDLSWFGFDPPLPLLNTHKHSFYRKRKWHQTWCLQQQQQQKSHAHIELLNSKHDVFNRSNFTIQFVVRLIHMTPRKSNLCWRWSVSVVFPIFFLWQVRMLVCCWTGWLQPWCPELTCSEFLLLSDVHQQKKRDTPAHPAWKVLQMCSFIGFLR